MRYFRSLGEHDKLEQGKSCTQLYEMYIKGINFRIVFVVFFGLHTSREENPPPCRIVNISLCVCLIKITPMYSITIIIPYAISTTALKSKARRERKEKKIENRQHTFSFLVPSSTTFESVTVSASQSCTDIDMDMYTMYTHALHTMHINYQVWYDQ